MLGALLLLTGLIACVLNMDSTFVRDVYLWPRLATPTCLFVGFIGAVQRSPGLSRASTIVAWVGIGLFILLAILTIIPGELIRASENPRGPSGAFSAMRFALLITLGISVAILFRRLRAAWAAFDVDRSVAR